MTWRVLSASSSDLIARNQESGHYKWALHCYGYYLLVWFPHWCHQAIFYFVCIMLDAVPLLQSRTTSTMASNEGSLHYIYLDPSKPLLSLFTLYHIQGDMLHDWQGLFNKAIQQQCCPSCQELNIVISSFSFAHVQSPRKARILRATTAVLQKEETTHSLDYPPSSCVDQSPELCWAINHSIF